MYSDTIADMLTRIRNGYLAHKATVTMPHSKNKEAIAEVMKTKKYLKDVRNEENNGKKQLTVELLYNNKVPALTHIERISKSGRRVYSQSKELPFVLSGYGIAIVSTSRGVMTVTQARKQNLGGEIICKIW